MSSADGSPDPGPAPGSSGNLPFTVLLVCTGNICRSAFAQQLGRAYLDQVLGEDAGPIRLVSAGTHAVVGSAMHPVSALVLRGYGVEAGDFRAQQLRDTHATQADLILTMTRAHRREVLHLAPRHLARTFILREAAALLDVVGDDAPAADGGFGDRARALVRAMADARSKRADAGGDDVPDPIGRTASVHEEAGELIVDALLPILARLAALHDEAGATP